MLINLMTEIQTAEMLSISVSKLQRDRWNNIGLSYVKIGKAVRYSSEDVMKYIHDKTVKTKKKAEEN